MGKMMCVSALALAIATIQPVEAYAQDKVATTADIENSPADDDIVVTATLRSESLQEVPLAVSAYQTEALEAAGVRNIADLASVSASFNASNSNSETAATTIRLRGVGTTGNNTGLESAVGVFLDGVYLSRPGIALSDLLDVEQVEVLRGPQGTLFGRNTSAGALNIRTKAPSLSEVDGFANITYGNYDLINVQGGVSVPIVQDRLALRISGAVRKRDGVIHNAVGGESNDRNRYLIRGQLLWQPQDNLSVWLIADYARSNEKCCDAVVVSDSSYVAAGLYAASGLPANGGVPNAGSEAIKSRLTSNNGEFHDPLRQWGVSGQIDWDIGDAKLTYISAYRHSLAAKRAESDFVSANIFSTSNNTSSSSADTDRYYTKINTLSQELRIAGSAFDGRLDYLVGAYYLDEDIDELQSLTLGEDHQAYISAILRSLGVPGANSARTLFAGGVSSAGDFANNRFTQHARNISVFTNNSFHVTDTITLNFGLRYSDDHKSARFDQLSARSNACAAVNARAPLFAGTPLSAVVPLASALTCFPFTTAVGSGAGSPVEFDRDFKDSELNYTAKILWAPASNINTYASFTHGYKSGGFNLDPTAAIGGADPSFRSERVDSYEVGIKTRWLANALTANLAVYDMRIKDFQVLDFTGVQFTTFNVPKARSSGAELEITARPSDHFTAFGSLSYTDARYPDNCAGAASPALVRQLCGQSLTASPKWVAIAGFDARQPVGNDLEVFLNGQVRMESDRRTTTQALTAVAAGTGTEGPTNNFIRTPYDIQDGNAKVNLRFGIGREDSLWRIEFWGDNIFNVTTYGQSFSVPLRGVGSLPGPFNAGGISSARAVFLQEPRTYGVTLRSRF